MRKKEKQVQAALPGGFSEFYRTLLEAYYRQYQFLTAQITSFETRLARHMEAYSRQVELLQTIPGVDRIVAWTLIAELGADPATFPDAEHCASWAGLTPGEDESAGKQKSQRCKPGNKYVQRVLAQSAWAVSRCKHGYLRAFFYQVKARRGWAKAIIAVAHKILVIAFTMLRDNQPYRERGDDYFDQLHPVRTAKRLVRRLEALGMEVQLVPRGAQSSN